MTTLQKNIDRYMNIKGMSYYTDLLMAIAKIQGMKKDEAIVFANKEKSNFSKMLKGERPLKYDYIIPLEKIFGVPLAKLLEEQPYFDAINKDDIPFIKGFRYYAYKDELELYDELDKTLTVDGDEILNNSDEFNRFFMDYLIEYRAFNGLRFLVNRHNFKLNPINDRLYQMDNCSMVISTLPEQITKFVIDSNDGDLFHKIYDPFEYLIKKPCKDMECLYTSKIFIESVLNNDVIFNSIFSVRKFSFEEINRGVEPKDGYKPDILCVNPLLNICLEFALEDIKSYKEQAEKILKYGIEYNKSVLEKISIPLSECKVDQFGGLYVGWRCYQGNLIIVDKNKTGIESVDTLLKSLPALKKGE